MSKPKRIPTCHPDRTHEGHGLCKLCYLRENRKQNLDSRREYDREYARGHKKEKAAYRRKHRKENIEVRNKHREEANQYYKDHRDEKLEYAGKYRLDNRDKHNANNSKRRAILREAADPTANKDTIEAFYEQAIRLSIQLGILFEVDHIIPIARGGVHHERNLQVIPATINVRKNARILSNPIWSDPRFSLLAEYTL